MDREPDKVWGYAIAKDIEELHGITVGNIRRIMGDVPDNAILEVHSDDREDSFGRLISKGYMLVLATRPRIRDLIAEDKKQP